MSQLMKPGINNCQVPASGRPSGPPSSPPPGLITKSQTSVSTWHTYGSQFPHDNMEEMETESEADTDPEEINDIEYYLALKEGTMMVDTKILVIKILNDLIDNLPAQAKT